MTGRLGALAPLAGLGAWLLTLNLLALTVWSHALATFALLLALAIALWLFFGFRLRSRPGLPEVSEAREGSTLRRRVLVGLLVVCLGAQVHQAWLGFDEESGFLVDIALNTECAATALLDGRNPWAERCQLWHDVPPMPGKVEVVAGVDGDNEVRMHGLRYAYGYPYFPAMAATYVPARAILGDGRAMRVTNVLLVLAHLVFLPLLVRRLVQGDPTEAILVALVAFLGVGRFGRELFEYAVTDIAISFWALLGFLAASHRRFALSGALLGVASACKLLPGPFLVVPFALALWVRGDRREALRLGVAWGVTSTAIVLPAILADAESFFTATILFYLTYHSVGDDTSLFVHLPEAARPVFQAIGYATSAAVLVAAALRRDRPALVAALEATFLGWIVFVAFARMIHLNYLVGVYALGTVALAWTTSRSLR